MIRMWLSSQSPSEYHDKVCLYGFPEYKFPVRLRSFSANDLFLDDCKINSPDEGDARVDHLALSRGGKFSTGCWRSIVQIYYAVQQATQVATTLLACWFCLWNWNLWTMSSDSVDKTYAFSKTTISLFLNMKRSGNYQPCYDDKCLICPELQMKWSVSDWDSLSSWPQDNKKVMHKNPMIQIKFLSLSQSCHLMQEAMFICILQWQILYCKCLLAEDTIHLSVAPEVLLLVPVLHQVPVLIVRNLMAHLLQWLEAASKHKFFCCHSSALQWWLDDSLVLHWLLLIEEKEEGTGNIYLLIHFPMV